MSLPMHVDLPIAQVQTAIPVPQGQEVTLRKIEEQQKATDARLTQLTALVVKELSATRTTKQRALPWGKVLVSLSAATFPTALSAFYAQQIDTLMLFGVTLVTAAVVLIGWACDG